MKIFHTLDEAGCSLGGKYLRSQIFTHVLLRGLALIWQFWLRECRDVQKM